LYVSDASGHVPTIGTAQSRLGMLRGNLTSPRLFDIAADQIRGLRSRMFMDAVLEGKIKGKLFRLGRSVRDIEMAAKISRPAAAYASAQTDSHVSELHKYPTNLRKLLSGLVDDLIRHGAECSEATLASYPV
jgi:NTE family protein